MKIYKFKFVFLIILISVILNLLSSKSFAKELITDGKGMWVNIFNYPENPDLFCENLRSHGVDTIWLQISRSNTPAIKYPLQINKILKSAHARDMKVIGWSYPYLDDPVTDAHKFIKAAQYTTPDGDMLDGIAADIEETTNAKAINKYSAIIRKSLGNKYPLIAITYSPMLKRAEPRNYAWKTIADNFDIIAPMTYWTAYKKYRSEDGAYDFTALTIKRLREYTNQDVKIHLIGDGQKTSTSEVKGFLRAAKDYNIEGVSLYPWHKPAQNHISVLGKF